MENIFPLTKNSSLIFENRKLFSDFKHLILKLTYLAKTRRGLDGICSRPARDLTETYPGPTQDLPGT
jgi:hypothetical protein